MKKVLVLTLVLGLVSVANATMTLSITAAPSTINLSGTAALGIYASGLSSGDDFYFVLVCDTRKADISGGTAIPPFSLLPEPASYWGWPGPMDGIIGGCGNIGPGPYDPGEYVRDVTFDPSVTGVITVYLLTTADFGEWTLVDTKNITVTPEPMPLALLSLGGLFIRRK